MSEKKYIIRYTLGSRTEWKYSHGIKEGDTHSGRSRNNELVIMVTLTEAQKYVKKIVKLRKKDNGGIVTKIQILDAETDKIMDNEKQEEISRFELMEL